MNPLSTSERDLLDLVRMDDLVTVAGELIRQPGENPPGGEGATAETLARICADRGLQVSINEVRPGRPNVSATLPGGGGRGLLLLGHTDVVPVGEGWSEEPFGGVVRDGRLYGRGSADMKGGLAACVVAMSALREAGIALDGPVELAAVVDEEETGAGIRHYLTSDRSDFAGCLVAEPTDLQTIVAARGDSYVEIAVGGRSAHSGNPADGVNAIHGAARIIGAIEGWHAELAAEAHPLVGPATWSTGLVRGGTGTSTVPASCLVTADRRLLPAEGGAEVLADVRRRVDLLDLAALGLTVEVTMTMEMPGFETPPDHPLVETADRALGDSGGPGRPLAGWTAACDGGFVARDAHVPVVVLGAGSVVDAAHRPDESIAVDDLVVAARAYTLLAARLLGR